MKRILFFILMCLSLANLSAQNRTLTGVVVDAKDEPLIGATIMEPTKKTGTVSDIDGRFSLSISGNTVDVSYLGYKKQKVNVDGKNDIKVILEEDGHLLDDVVVTALGIKRDKKALGYDVQDMAGDKLSTVPSVSPLGALAGNITGLNVSTSGSGPGGTVKLQIRGANSLTGNNEPLYVVDGVPLDNASGNQVRDGGGFDFGNAANNINPDDIENISVLKGGAAAALYGSRGQNGVVMITTKQGKQGGKLEVSLKSSLTFMQAIELPKLQNDYAQGAAGNLVLKETNSWGPKMAGQSFKNFLNQDVTLNRNTENPFDQYFQTGTNFSNTLSINKGLDKGSFYISINNLQSKGIVPTEKFKKLNLNLRVTYDLTKYLNVDAKVNLVNQKANNRVNLLNSPDNPMYSLLHIPRSVYLDQLETYITPGGYPVIFNQDYTMGENGAVFGRTGDNNLQLGGTPYVQNPYWTQNMNTNEDTRSRLISFVKFDLNLKSIFSGLPLDRLNLMGRAGIDYYVDKRRNQVSERTLYKPGGTGTLDTYKADYTETNFDFLLSGFKQAGDFGLSASFGGNLRHNEVSGKTFASATGKINEYGGYVEQNMRSGSVNEIMSSREMQSVYGMATLDYKSMLYLDVTGRNDWSSTLASSNRSFFYPSVSFSWIVSQSLKLPEFVNHLKYRVSYAVVGNDVGPGQIYYTYAINPNQFKGLPYAGLPSTKPKYDILPEKTRSFETGIESRFVNGRFGIDLSYYKTGTKNQIFNVPVAPSSGFKNARINSGLISNHGIELSLKGDIIQTKDLSFGLVFNVSRNYAKVDELAEGFDVLTLGGLAGVQIRAMLGEAPGTMVGTAYKRDTEGNIMLDSKNLPMISQNEGGANDNQIVLGNCMPKWISGVGANFSYKGLFADIFIDGKFGHEMYSYTNAQGSRIGTLSNTVDGRDAWTQAKILGNASGVDPREIGGKAVTGSRDGVVGTYYADPQEYYIRLGEIHEEYIYNASYIRLQRASLGYRFMSNGLIRKIGAQNLMVSIVGSNLFYLMKHTPNTTPNSVITTGTFGGIEMYSYPETRSFGFSLGLTF